MIVTMIMIHSQLLMELLGIFTLAEVYSINFYFLIESLILKIFLRFLKSFRIFKHFASIDVPKKIKIINNTHLEWIVG
jgi:hypothetical protein